MCLAINSLTSGKNTKPIYNSKHDTGWAEGAQRARHPKTTLPHRPPGPLAAASLGGVGASPGSHTLAWSHNGSRRLRLSLLPAPVKVACAGGCLRTALRSAPTFARLKTWPRGARAQLQFSWVSLAHRPFQQLPGQVYHRHVSAFYFCAACSTVQLIGERHNSINWTVGHAAHT